MNRQELLDAGYREYISDIDRNKYRTLFQKRIKEGKITKYFIDIYEYNHDIPEIGLSYEIDLRTQKSIDGTLYFFSTKIHGFFEFDAATNSRDYDVVSIEQLEKVCKDYFTLNQFSNYDNGD